MGRREEYERKNGEEGMGELTDLRKGILVYWRGN